MKKKITLILIILLLLSILPTLFEKTKAQENNYPPSDVFSDVNSRLEPYQRKTFYHLGRFWVFYSIIYGYGSEEFYKTSSDGLSWSSATNVTEEGIGTYWVDYGINKLWYVKHYAYRIRTGRATMYSSGDITWDYYEDYVWNGTQDNPPRDPYIFVSSNNTVWVTFLKNNNWFALYKKSKNAGAGEWNLVYNVTISKHLLLSIHEISSGEILLVGNCKSSDSVDNRKTITVFRTNGSITSYIYTSLYIIEYYSAVTINDTLYITITEYITTNTYRLGLLKFNATDNSFTYSIIRQFSSSGCIRASIGKWKNELYIVGNVPQLVASSTYKLRMFIFYSHNGGSEWTYFLTSRAYPSYPVTDVTVEYEAHNDKLSIFYTVFDVYNNASNLPYPTGQHFYINVTDNLRICGFMSPWRINMYPDRYYYINATIINKAGAENFVNATVKLTGNIILKWDNATNTFSKYSDPNNYCTLDTSGSQSIKISSIAYSLAWRIKLAWYYPEGWVSVLGDGTKVYNSSGYVNSLGINNLFYFEDDIYIHSASVNDNRINPAQSITFYTSIYYYTNDGRIQSIANGQGITVYLTLNGATKATVSNPSNPSSSFPFPSISGESNVGKYTYLIYAVTDEPSIQNKTVDVIVDRLTISYKGVSSERVNVGASGEVRFRIKREYDNTIVSSGNLYINGTATSWDSTNKWWKKSFTQTTVCKKFYVITSASDGSYGINALAPGVTTNSTYIIWDGLNITSYNVDLDNEKIYIKMIYAYDGLSISGGTINYLGQSATNSTGWAVFDSSAYSNVDFNTIAYGVLEPNYGLTKPLRNQTIAYCKRTVEEFKIKSFNDITNTNWDGQNLVFHSSGSKIIVDVGSHGNASSVKVNGQPYNDWEYDEVHQRIIIYNVASEVIITWISGLEVSKDIIYEGEGKYNVSLTLKYAGGNIIPNGWLGIKFPNNTIWERQVDSNGKYYLYLTQQNISCGTYVFYGINDTDGVTQPTINASLTIYYLNITTLRCTGEVLNEGIINITKNGTNVNVATPNFTYYYPNGTFKIEVWWQGIKVNDTFNSYNLNSNSSLTLKLNIWEMTFNARDYHGNVISLPVELGWTFSNKTLKTISANAGILSFLVANGTHYYKVKYQGVWVSENVSVVLDKANTTTINKNCWVFKLVVYTQTTNDSKPNPLSALTGVNLTLVRKTDNKILNGLYGLSSTIETTDYNSTYGRYVFYFLANHTYDVTGYIPSAGEPKTASADLRSLSSDKEVVIQLRIVGGGNSEGRTPTTPTTTTTTTTPQTQETTSITSATTFITTMTTAINGTTYIATRTAMFPQGGILRFYNLIVKAKDTEGNPIILGTIRLLKGSILVEEKTIEDGMAIFVGLQEGGYTIKVYDEYKKLIGIKDIYLNDNMVVTVICKLTPIELIMQEEYWKNIREFITTPELIIIFIIICIFVLFIIFREEVRKASKKEIEVWI